MSSLISQGRVLDTGDIKETADAFEGSMLFSKATFPDAQLILDEPIGEGEWLYVEGVFVDAAPARKQAEEIAKKTEAETAANVAALERDRRKRERVDAVEAIRVTTTAGNVFDGDETSQTRMSRAILVLSTGYAASVPWVLADNTVIDATSAELTEALVRAGAAQAALWVIE